ncbi:hypothetical protein [uncultured Thiothrix sp.]|jgi:hypothetical protein|uniref:hypothetical protein n=1 Tax=uncultured Thiothrix sp. TaxID=223185 RepID=UPI002629055F|nr:hypothetical protein [uncultured Thiothrix sp.]HMT91491.1 hypothetical protein [Thiolinea sp.]
MTLELDHIFIAVAPNAPEAELFRDFGLIEGTPNQHLGQGTANRRFFFENAFVELLYLTDAAEAQSEVMRETHLYERLTQDTPSISPFGVCFRYQQGVEKQTPFPCWDYRPTYLPSHLSITMALDNPLTEPLWFVLPFGIAPALAATDKLQPLQHEKGFRQLTKVQITQPSALLSIAATQANTLDSFHIKKGKEQLVELSFDHEQAGLDYDFRPHLPLVMHW